MSGERGGGVVAKTAAQTGQEVVLSERLPSELPDPKFTAAQIEKDCPARLHDLAKEITEGLEKVYEQEKLADDQVIAVIAHSLSLNEGVAMAKRIVTILSLTTWAAALLSSHHPRRLGRHIRRFVERSASRRGHLCDGLFSSNSS